MEEVEVKQLRAEMDDLLRAQRETTAAVRELAASTEGVVQLYNDLQGAARIGLAVQKFVIWCSKWSLVGAAAVAFLNYITKHHFPGG